MRLLLFAGNRLGRALTSACIRVRTLPTHRETFSVTQPSIAAEVHQSLDVHRHFATQIAFDQKVAVDHFADLQDFLVGELRHPASGVEMHLVHALLGLLLPDAMDVLQRYHDALVGWNVHASDTCQSRYS